MVDKQNMTYKQLIAQLRKVIKEQPELADKFVCLYQTDNWCRQVDHMQIGCGGTFIHATKDWDGPL